MYHDHWEVTPTRPLDIARGKVVVTVHHFTREYAIMTLKDYSLLAEHISRIDNEEVRRIAALAVSDALRRDNDRFCFYRFLTACNVEQIK